MAQVITTAAADALQRGEIQLDSLQVTWNLKGGEEVESPEVLFYNMDDLMAAIATALVESELDMDADGSQWHLVSSYQMTIVKDCIILQDTPLHTHGLGGRKGH